MEKFFKETLKIIILSPCWLIGGFVLWILNRNYSLEEGYRKAWEVMFE